MDAQVRLAVSIEIQGAQADGTRHRLFEDPGIDGRSVVDCKPRPRDIQGKQLHIRNLTTMEPCAQGSAGF